MQLRHFGSLALLPLLLSACATLGGVGIQAPRFAVADGQPAELQLLGPSLDRPVGGVALRLYARVDNPNPIGVTLSRLRGTLELEGFDAAAADFPLGVPLDAGGSTVVPLDLVVSFANLPALADVFTRGITGRTIAYSLRGVATVDAGVLGEPTFGPMTLLTGGVVLRR